MPFSYLWSVNDDNEHYTVSAFRDGVFVTDEILNIADYPTEESITAVSAAYAAKVRDFALAQDVKDAEIAAAQAAAAAVASSLRASQPSAPINII